MEDTLLRLESSYEFFSIQSLPSNIQFQNGVGKKHGGGIFASQTGSLVHDTCLNFIRRDIFFTIFETLELGDGSCLHTNI